MGRRWDQVRTAAEPLAWAIAPFLMIGAADAQSTPQAAADGPATVAQLQPNPAAPGAGAAPSLEAEQGVTDIIVTSQRRTQNIQDVPQSVTAVTADDLANESINDLSRLDALVPGLKFGQSGNDSRPAIRGTRTQNVVGNADPLVSFYVDDVYRSRPGQQLSPFYDLSQVEVVKGPQGTLFGRNSLGGAVDVITHTPSTAGLDYGGAVQATNYNGVRAEGFLNVPVTDQLAVRVAGYEAQRDGWVHNTGSGGDLHDEDNQSGRAEVLWTPTDDIENVARVEYWHGGGNGSGGYGYYYPGVPIDPKTGKTTAVNGIVVNRISPLASDPTGANGGGYYQAPPNLAFNTPGDSNWQTVSTNFPAVRSVNQTSVSDTLKVGLGDFADLKGIFSYTTYREERQDDPDYASQPVAWEQERIRTQTWSEEIQLASKQPGPFTWVTGVYLLQDRPNDIYLSGTDFNGTLPGGRSITLNGALDKNLYVGGPDGSFTNAWATYADGTYAVLPWLRALGGVRWTQDDKFAYTENPNYDQLGEPPTTATKNFDRITWRAGGQADLSERSMVYFTYSTGFLSGGFSGGGLQAFSPTTAEAFEIGSKNVFFDDKLRLNLAIYDNDYSNIVTQKLTQVGSVIVTTTTNAGSIRAKGAEAELDFYPVDRAYLGFRGAYTDAHFGDFTAANSFNEGGNTIGNGFQLQGYQVPLNPTWTLTGIVSYEFDLGGFGVLTPSATVFHSSRYRTSDQPYFFAYQKTYTTLDAFVRWKPSADSKYSVSMFGNNVTNQRILLRTTPNSGQVIDQDFANPAIFGARIAYNY